jgi:probable addiction module antidote protein
MPKRTRDHHEWLLEQLLETAFAADYLNVARQESQSSFLKALRNVAEARRMAVVAHEAGVNRESLYRALSEEGNPRLDTYDSVLDALGLAYEFKPKVAITTSEALVPNTQAQASTSITSIVGTSLDLAGTCTITNTFMNSATSAFIIADERMAEQIPDIPPPYMLSAMSQMQAANQE